VSGAPFTETGQRQRRLGPTPRRRSRRCREGALTDARAKALLPEVHAALTGPFKAGYDSLIAWQREDRDHDPRASGRRARAA
jgi:hypothetical protein